MAVAVLAATVAPVVYAQRPMARRPAQGRPREALIERWNQMTPEERDRALRSLPPARRAQIERRLEEYRRLPPEEKERLRRKFSAFNELSPEKQRQMRMVYRRFRELPETRRGPMTRQMRILRQMTPEERREHLGGEAVKKQFSAGERKMLEDLADVFDEVKE